MQLPGANAHDKVEGRVEDHGDPAHFVDYRPPAAQLLALHVAVFCYFYAQLVGLVCVCKRPVIEQNIVKIEVRFATLCEA